MNDTKRDIRKIGQGPKRNGFPLQKLNTEARILLLPRNALTINES
jgi:hypothetical protein